MGVHDYKEGFRVKTHTLKGIECVRETQCGMLYADDAGDVCELGESLASLITVAIKKFEAAGLTELGTKTKAVVNTDTSTGYSRSYRS